MTRTYHVNGAPREAGRHLGRALGPRLEAIIRAYLDAWPSRDGVLRPDLLRAGAESWLAALPERWRAELEGLAEGARLPSRRVAEWYWAEQCAAMGCSAFFARADGRTWVARNNDAWAPPLWGFTLVHEIEGRIPTLTFGLEGDVFTSTGVNRERLWLHYHALDPPAAAADGALDAFVFVAEALETCTSLADVESLLRTTPRTTGMLLFGLDGKTDEATIWECGRREFGRRESDALVGTNHRVGEDAAGTSCARHDRIAELLAAAGPEPAAPADLIRILADAGVEQRERDRVTVFATVACPAEGVLWHAHGEGPAASTGGWRHVRWPWTRADARRGARPGRWPPERPCDKMTP